MRRITALLVVTALALGACGGETADPGDPDATTTTVDPDAPPTTRNRADLEVDDGVADPEPGEWLTSSGDVCPYGLVVGDEVQEAGAAPSIFVGEGIDQLRFSSACPFELLDH